MSPIARTHPDFLDTQIRVPWQGVTRWRNEDGDRLYEYDSRHGHVEAYNSRGRHVGVLDVKSGVRIGGAKAGRKIDV
jgi:hypothetical protein